MHKNINFLFLIICIFLSLKLNAQKGLANSVVTGKIVENESKKPVEFASVRLLKNTDSSLIAGTITDNKGTFTLEKIPAGEYFIKYSFIGFETSKTSAFKITSGRGKFDLGTLTISASDQMMNEVVVTGEKSTYINAIDRRVYNIENDMMSKTGVVSDLLQNIPSVSVDIDGNVSLRGSENVMILINGKPSNFTSASRADMLQQMPANSVERIEVVTNPSAKYKPDGTSGIINIVTKKNTNIGFNGSLTANAGNKDRYNSNFALNYKPGKLNIFGSYGIRKDNRTRLGDETRHVLEPNSLPIEITSRETSRPLSNIVKAGIDYDLNKKNQFGVSGSYNYRDMVKNGNSDNITRNISGEISDRYIRHRRDPEFEEESSITTYYSHKFKKEGHELLINSEFQQSAEEEDNQYTNQYLTPVLPSQLDNVLIRSNVKQNDLAVEYTNPISESIEIESGYNWLYENTDLPFKAEFLNNATKVWIKDDEKTNQFRYLQNIHAVYFTYSQEIDNFSFKAGIRAEKSFITSKLITLDSIVPNNYVSFYPTIHLKQQVGKKGELQLNYSHRVNRPESDELNPFPEYADPRNLRAGNPKLKPEYIHSLEFGYLHKTEKLSLLSTIYYRKKYNGFTSVTVPLNDSTLLTTEQNLSNDQSAGLEIVANLSINKTLNTNLSSNIYYNQIDASNLGYSNKKSNIVWMAKINSTANITKSTMLQLNASYQAPRLTPQGKIMARYIVNIALRRDILNKKASIILTASDLFNTMKESSEISTPSLYKYSTRRRDAQIIYLGFTYRFGTMKKTKDENVQFDDKL